MSTIVIDNGSQDGTIEEVRKRPWVDLVTNRENRGFAAAVNQGVRRNPTDFVLLLNPDIELMTGVEPLVEACENPEIGIASGQLTDDVGMPQVGFSIRRFPDPLALSFEVLGINRLLPGNPVNGRYRALDIDPEQATDIEQPAGAFLLFRRDAWSKVGGLDDSFHPLWFEDVDFCKRIRDAGLKIRYVPAVKAVHQGGHSVRQLEWARREHYWYVSLLRYASKHFRSINFRAMGITVVLGAISRTVIRVVQQRSFEPCAVYAGVIRLAAACAFTGRIPELRFSGVPEDKQ
jgi:GT2 family glycosyltransferase